jgi:alpha-beta hydrolase superfamily lysophospholipase
MNETQEVVIAGNEHVAVWHRASRKPSVAHVLVMHGAGQSSSERYAPLCAQFAEHGVSTTRMDFSGHGHSSANTVGSLKKRLFEARQVLQRLPAYVAEDAAPVYVLSSSMSGEITIRLACDTANDSGVAVSGMILVAPAVYAEEAFDIDFGPAFTAVLRREGSWRSALTLSLLRQPHVPLLLIRPGLDTVIPPAVTDAIIENGTVGGNVEEIVFPDAGHALATETTTNVELLMQVARDCCRFMNRARPDRS